MADTIAVVFDFDDTLAPDSTSSFIESLGLEPEKFWRKTVDPLVAAGWDPIPAYLHCLIEYSRKGKTSPRITRDKLIAWGKKLSPFSGAGRLFGKIEKAARAVAPEVSVEFYLISSGIGEIIRSTKIAPHFSDIWTCDFHYGADGGIVFPKNIVSFTDKTRYLFQIAKGLTGDKWRGKPFAVNHKRELRVPFENMIVVGDGYTDVPCFSLVQQHGGVAIGVYDAEDEARRLRAWGFIEEKRVANLVPADYTAKSALTFSLTMAVESVARRLALRPYMFQG